MHFAPIRHLFRKNPRTKKYMGSSITVFSQQFVYEQLKLIFTQICQVRTSFGSDYTVLLLSHTLCIRYSLYQRFSVLQLAWFIHDVAF